MPTCVPLVPAPSVGALRFMDRGSTIGLEYGLVPIIADSGGSWTNVIRAPNRHRVRTFIPVRKDNHWGMGQVM
jgi:hypothetical protein